MLEGGRRVDVDDIADERWAKDLDVLSGFAIMEDGTLILCDDEGQYVVCPERRFEVSSI